MEFELSQVSVVFFDEFSRKYNHAKNEPEPLTIQWLNGYSQTFMAKYDVALEINTLVNAKKLINNKKFDLDWVE